MDRYDFLLFQGIDYTRSVGDYVSLVSSAEKEERAREQGDVL